MDNRIVFRFPEGRSAMGILDEAIREHLELKRQHGADDSELKQLEDEAFAAPGRPGDEEAAPDSLAEAPTEFMTAPGAAPEATGEERPERDAPDIAALQEAPEPPSEPESPGPSTEEREVIADQPTEMYDVAAEIDAEGSGEAEAVVEEEVVAADEVGEEVEEEDDFWDEQRLSDELSQALEAPAEEPEPEAVEAEVEIEEVEIVEEGEVDEEPEGATEPARRDHGDEDILEDTPDFLEDSEDDQLWFEQKPPKDFDFDD
jgi:hypothetical protein